MRPKRYAPTAAVCALVVAAAAGCGGGGGSEAKEVAETFDLSALAGADTSDVASTGFVPAYAVNGTATVRVGEYPSAVAVNPETNKIYVANRDGGTVTVVDGKTNRTTTVKVGPRPNMVAVNQVTDKIYVANLAGRDANGNEDTNRPGSVTVIDGKTNKTTEVRAGLEAYAVAVNEKTNKIYVGNQGSNDVTVIDGRTRKTATIKLRKETDTLTEGVLSPQDVEIDKVTNTIYVTGSQSNTVAVIDGNTNKFTVVSTQGKAGNERETGFTPTSLAVDSVRNMIYTSDFGSHDMTVIDGKTKAVNGIVPEDIQEPYVIAVNEKTNKIYMGSPTSRSVTVVDGATRQPVTIGDLPGKPNDVAINRVTNKIYFPLSVAYKGAQVGDDKQITGVILEVDGATNKIVMAIAGVSPWAVAVNEKTNKVYVVNREGNTMTVFSPGKD